MNIELSSIIHLLKSRNLEFRVIGEDIPVKKLSAIESGVCEAVCYYVGDNPDTLAGIERSIIVCKPEAENNLGQNNSYIITENPQLCFYHISSLFEDKTESGIHENSVIHPSSVIRKNVSIGPFCMIEESVIGDNVVIESGVKIHKGTIVGDNVQIECNSVIGATGVMWAWDDKGNKVRCVQTGGVIIQSDVFIGSNVTIVRGAFENKPTIINKESFIGHGTLIGHGSIIGENNHLASNISLSGTVQTGNNCFLGSAVSVRPNTKIPDNTTVGIGAVVVKNFLETGLTLFGNPAEKLKLKTYSGKLAGIPARHK